jgi:hypothetical protein
MKFWRNTIYNSTKKHQLPGNSFPRNAWPPHPTQQGITEMWPRHQENQTVRTLSFTEVLTLPQLDYRPSGMSMRLVSAWKLMSWTSAHWKDHKHNHNNPDTELIWVQNTASTHTSMQTSTQCTHTTHTHKAHRACTLHTHTQAQCTRTTQADMHIWTTCTPHTYAHEQIHSAHIHTSTYTRTCICTEVYSAHTLLICIHTHKYHTCLLTSTHSHMPPTCICKNTHAGLPHMHTHTHTHTHTTIHTVHYLDFDKVTLRSNGLGLFYTCGTWKCEKMILVCASHLTVSSPPSPL